MLLAATTLRPQLVGVAPLIPDIQSGLGLSHSLAGLIATIPVVSMGIFAPPAAYLFSRFGSRAGIAASLLAIGVFGLLRAAAGDAVTLLLPTLGIGIGMGLGGALLPITVKERLPARAVAGTTAYAIGIQGGAALAAAVAVPVAASLGGWRAALVTFSLVAVIAAVAWLALSSRRAAPAAAAPVAATPPRGIGHAMVRPVAWWLAILFALFGIVYYGLVAWLPDAFVERGWDPVAAGRLLALLNAASLLGTFAVPFLRRVDPTGHRVLRLLSATFALGVAGFLVAPPLAVACALVTGLSNGGMFPLMLALPLEASETPGEAAGMSGLMLGVGYTLAAAAPVVLGLLRDATGSFESGLVAVAVTAAALMALLVAYRGAHRPVMVQADVEAITEAAE